MNRQDEEAVKRFRKEVGNVGVDMPMSDFYRKVEQFVLKERQRAKMEAIDSMIDSFAEQQKHLGQVCIDSEGTQGCDEANNYVWLIGEISKYKSQQGEGEGV